MFFSLISICSLKMHILTEGIKSTYREPKCNNNSFFVSKFSLLNHAIQQAGSKCIHNHDSANTLMYLTYTKTTTSFNAISKNIKNEEWLYRRKWYTNFMRDNICISLSPYHMPNVSIRKASKRLFLLGFSHVQVCGMRDKRFIHKKFYTFNICLPFVYYDVPIIFGNLPTKTQKHVHHMSA